MRKATQITPFLFLIPIFLLMRGVHGTTHAQCQPPYVLVAQSMHIGEKRLNPGDCYTPVQDDRISPPANLAQKVGQ